jgi:hypothetical protein
MSSKPKRERNVDKLVSCFLWIVIVRYVK